MKKSFWKYIQFGRVESRVMVLGVVVMVGVVCRLPYHMALVSMQRNSEAKQEATRWHLNIRVE